MPVQFPILKNGSGVPAAVVETEEPGKERKNGKKKS